MAPPGAKVVFKPKGITMATNRVTLVEEPRRMAMCETTMRYGVYLDGKRLDELYWNMSGYRGGIPCPDGYMLDPGEVSLAKFEAEVKKINREWGNQPVPAKWA